jgi:hypothetical protein
MIDTIMEPPLPEKVQRELADVYEPLRAKVDHKVMPYDPHVIGGISGVLKSSPMMWYQDFVPALEAYLEIIVEGYQSLKQPQ